jgi:hypothetical protein
MIDGNVDISTAWEDMRYSSYMSYFWTSRKLMIQLGGNCYRPFSLNSVYS